MRPLISVIIPCYNQEKYLDQCLGSLKEQGYENWEAIIVNDGSSDRSEEIITSWIKSDQRIRMINTPHVGVSNARNAALDIVKGTFIQFLDADDWIEPERFEKCITIVNNKKYDIIISNFRMFEQSRKKFEPAYCDMSKVPFSYQEFLHNWDVTFSFPPSVGFFKTDLLGDFKFDTRFAIVEDWLLWLHAFKRSGSYFYIDEPLVIYRMHANNSTKNMRKFAENKAKIFEYVYKHQLTTDQERAEFFHSTNRVYLNIINNLIDKHHIIEGSIRYKIGGIFLRPVSALKKLGVVDKFIQKRNKGNAGSR